MDLATLKANVTHARDWIEQGREAFAWGMLDIVLNDLDKLEQELARAAIGPPLSVRPVSSSAQAMPQHRPSTADDDQPVPCRAAA